MLIQQLTILFSLLMAALVASLFFHTYQSRRKILTNFKRVPAEVPGTAVQKNILAYPSFEGKTGNRKVSAFFHTSEGKQTSIVYFTSAIETSAPFSLFLKREDFFRPATGARLEKTAGPVIEGLDSRFEARGTDEGRSRIFFRNEKVAHALPLMENYAAIVCGPDRIIISKPYDGIKDTRPEALLQGFHLLIDLAEAMESVG